MKGKKREIFFPQQLQRYRICFVSNFQLSNVNSFIISIQYVFRSVEKYRNDIRQCMTESNGVESKTKKQKRREREKRKIEKKIPASFNTPSNLHGIVANCEKGPFTSITFFLNSEFIRILIISLHTVCVCV